MFHDPHESPLSLLKRHVMAWKARAGVSMEAIADDIVAAHNAIDAPARTGIFFEPKSSDAFTRQKANAMRIRRWLEDDDANNLMSVNFLPSVLHAMPADLRVSFLNEYIGPLGLCVSASDEGESGELTMANVCEAVKEMSESVQALSVAVESPTAANLESLIKEADEAIEVKRKIGRIARAKLAAIKAGKSLVNRVLHRA